VLIVTASLKQSLTAALCK